MIDMIAEMLSYPFMLRALIVGTLVSLCAALLGVSLVLKRFSMIGDGLSHVGFGALAFAQVAGIAPLGVAIPVVVIAAVLLLRLSDNGKIKGDAAIAVISSFALAAGVLIISVGRGANTDLLNYMFGSILAMSTGDVALSVVLCLAVLVLYLFFYSDIFSVTFDESFARATGRKTSFYNTVIAVLTAVTVVLGMRMMGALLISALVIFPALSSMRIFKSYKKVTICSVVLSVICFFMGMFISYIYSLPTGASVVIIHTAVFLIFSLLNLLVRGLMKN